MQIKVKNNGYELLNYNNIDFPFYAELSNLSDYDSYSALCHWHNDIEITYVTEGKMQYNVNGRIETIEEGTAIFVNAKQLHYGFSDAFEDCKFICIVFNPIIVSGSSYIDELFVKPVTENKACPFLMVDGKTQAEKTVLNLIEQAYNASLNKSPELVLNRLAIMIWEQIYRLVPKNQDKRVVVDQYLLTLKAMMKFIRQNYRKKISLKSIADSGNVSKTKCGMMFKQYVGQTPIEYLTEFRLNRAIELVENTELSIIEVALECGFSGASYFCEIFRRKFNSSPLEVRKAYKLKLNSSAIS